jgi:hypothetical protein
VSPSNKLGMNQSNGSNLLGKNASIVMQLPCFRQGVEIAPGATTLGIVDIAPYASLSNKLGINIAPYASLSTIMLGNVRSSSQTTIKGHGEKSIKQGRGHSLRQSGDKKSMCHDHGRSLHKTRDKKSIYIKHARGRSLRLFAEKLTIQILWHEASKLIRKKKRPPERPEISHLRTLSHG